MGVLLNLPQLPATMEVYDLAHDKAVTMPVKGWAVRVIESCSDTNPYPGVAYSVKLASGLRLIAAIEVEV